MAMHKIHFMDEIGQATITCDTDEEYDEALANIKADPMCDDIWTETYDPDEGWQA